MSKIEVGKTYQTRDGRNVRILATDLKHTHPVLGAILYEDGTELVSTFGADGSYSSSGAEDKFDLIIPPERKSRWLNWCDNDHPYTRLFEYRSREEAEKFADPHRTHVFEIIIEDGESVDVKIHKVESER